MMCDSRHFWYTQKLPAERSAAHLELQDDVRQPVLLVQLALEAAERSPEVGGIEAAVQQAKGTPRKREAGDKAVGAALELGAPVALVHAVGKCDVEIVALDAPPLVHKERHVQPCTAGATLSPAPSGVQGTRCGTARVSPYNEGIRSQNTNSHFI